jgi:hypothetical protein
MPFAAWNRPDHRSGPGKHQPSAGLFRAIFYPYVELFPRVEVIANSAQVARTADPRMRERSRPHHWVGTMMGDPHKIDPFRSNGNMNNGLRGLLAGAGAWKWGGGCFGTVLVFVIIYVLLGHC